jgi:purine nucleoside permease
LSAPTDSTSSIAGDRDYNRVIEPLVVSIVLNNQAWTQLGASAIAKWVVDQHNIATVDYYELRGEWC